MKNAEQGTRIQPFIVEEHGDAYAVRDRHFHEPMLTGLTKSEAEAFAAKFERLIVERPAWLFGDE